MAEGVVNLADFLLARFAEDEAVARAAATYTSFEPGWVVDGGTQECGYTVRQERLRWELTEGANFAISDAEHIARWDPARVLTECQAKRQIVDEHSGRDGQECDYDGYRAPCPTLRLLALPYAEHPDYDSAWGPS